jgi:hypothetical protein
VIRDRLGGLVSSLWPYLLEETSMLAVMEDAPARALRSPVYAASAHGNASALAFRASRSDECFSSECFLLPYDLAHARGRGSQSLDAPGADVFVNPRVIVGYEWKQFVWWKYVTRHWAVRWWIMRMERGAEMPFARMIVGHHDRVWRWAGGDCFPVCAFAHLSWTYYAQTLCSGDDTVLVGGLREAPKAQFPSQPCVTWSTGFLRGGPVLPRDFVH